jgi:hypothetical protein
MNQLTNKEYLIACVTGVNKDGAQFSSTDLRASSDKDAIDKAKIWLFDSGFSNDIEYKVHVEVTKLECIYINQT